MNTWKPVADQSTSEYLMKRKLIVEKYEERGCEQILVLNMASIASLGSCLIASTPAPPHATAEGDVVEIHANSDGTYNVLTRPRDCTNLFLETMSSITGCDGGVGTLVAILPHPGIPTSLVPKSCINPGCGCKCSSRIGEAVCCNVYKNMNTKTIGENLNHMINKRACMSGCPDPTNCPKCVEQRPTNSCICK